MTRSLARSGGTAGRPLRWLALTLVGLGAVAACASETMAPAGEAVVVRIPVTGVIELGLAPFIDRSLREAEESGAVAAVLELETPGGRVDAAQRIVNSVEDAEIPVFAFVNRRAFSAGAMIALATDAIYMRPGGVIGAATPVTGEGEKAPEKIVSAMRSEMRALAERRGLDPRIAEAMVDEGIEVEGVVERGKLLTLTTEEAEEIGYGRAAEDMEDVLRQAGITADRVVDSDINWAEGLVRFLTHPIVSPFLLSLGFLGLLVEIKTPTFGLAGGAGIMSLALFFGGHYLVGLAGWEEMILMGAGLVFLLVEAFVVPGFGVFGLLGIGGVLASIYLSLVGNLSTIADYSQAAVVLSASVLLMLVSAWVLVRTLPRNSRLKRSGILLGEDTGRDVGYLSARVRSELVGKDGVAITDLRPAGVGRFDEERVDIVAEEGWLEAGTPIRITRSEGYRHVVRALDPADVAEPAPDGEPAAGEPH
jgi:membrane-bound serine protease (ClpP class)